MPLVQVNVTGSQAVEVEDGALGRALETAPKDAPVIICIHGYKFSPQVPAHTPHDHILALDPKRACRKAVSWPRALGFGGGDAAEGLCISLGWEARGSIWQAYERAAQTGEALARLIWKLDRPVHLIGHSLGARVALAALGHLHAGAVDRLVLLTAAEFRDKALAALDSEAGGAAEVINVTSRENDVYDWLFELALFKGDGDWRSLGSGLGTSRRNWVDVQIDDVQTRAALGRLGFSIPAADRLICHWSPYLRKGVFDFYASALRSPERLPMGLMQSLFERPHAPRWSRLLTPRLQPRSLPFRRNPTF
ncbi:alpha/beta fold hydrolase [Celeribacter arenosi]|uniref:AB hydrolase-1 domain-containing protein n=1 Tax=Celeribacter arenosi TaxID=792649 RepID=A0ABP7K9S1_9RHOB